MNINHITFSGNLTAQPDSRKTPAGKAVCSLRIANNFKSGENTETTFMDAVCWEKTAEVAAQYLTKGSPVVVEGRLKQEEWQDKQTGATRHKHVITVSRLHLFPASRSNESQGTADSGGAGPQDEIPFDGAGTTPANPFA